MSMQANHMAVWRVWVSESGSYDKSVILNVAWTIFCCSWPGVVACALIGRE